MHQYNCILQQRRGGMENKSSLGGAARWNHFEILEWRSILFRKLLAQYWCFTLTHVAGFSCPLIFLLCCHFPSSFEKLSICCAFVLSFRCFTTYPSITLIIFTSKISFQVVALHSLALPPPLSLSLSQLSRSFPLYKSFFSGRCCLSSLAFPPPPFCSSSSPSPLHTGSPSGYQVISCIYMEVILAVTYD